MEINRGYVLAQLAKAASPEWADKWTAVLRGMASGVLRIGSRTPVKDMPAWVTPEVLRGGFATGKAAAGGPLEPWESPSREQSFARALSDEGLAELETRLTSGAYRVRLPEEAALLTVAWLAGQGELTAALRLTEELAPQAERLRFLPTPAEPDPTPSDVVWRRTAGEATTTLRARKPNERVEAMREALEIWNPFADELLDHWLQTVVDGRVAAHYPEGWRAHGHALLDRYYTLALTYKRAAKHRRRRENLAILRIALTHAVHGPLPPKWRGLLQHAVDSMLAKRGAPGSPEHAELRAGEARIVDQPTHHALARVVVQRMAALPSDRGIESTDALLVPTEEGTAIPKAIRAAVERALAGTPETLIASGVVPSAEVLAELVPPIAAATIAHAYPDERLAALMAANYEAFRRRRSLLLLNLEHQVTVDELPWVRAVASFRGGNDEARDAFVRLGELALDAFPATPLPNPLIAELDTLAREAALDLPFTEELAADIFMGRFSPKFKRAAQLAATLLEGTEYATHFQLDAAVLDGDFDELCIARAGTKPGGVPANRRIIEQAQILTTHNLATLISAGVTVDAERAAARCREARTSKPWVQARIDRQRIFFESLIGK